MLAQTTSCPHMAGGVASGEVTKYNIKWMFEPEEGMSRNRIQIKLETRDTQRTRERERTREVAATTAARVRVADENLFKRFTFALIFVVCVYAFVWALCVFILLSLSMIKPHAWAFNAIAFLSLSLLSHKVRSIICFMNSEFETTTIIRREWVNERKRAQKKTMNARATKQIG